jgi:hypothetical protein
MTTKPIPDNETRICIECSKRNNYEKVETKQEAVAIQIRHNNRGCFRGGEKTKWKWKCLECGERQY